MLGSVAAQNATLEAIFGDNRAAGIPASFDARLYVGDPTAGGVEVAGTGYAPVTVANTTAVMGTPSGGALGPITIDFGMGAADWGTPDYWAFTDGSDLWVVLPIANPAAIGDTDPVTLNPTITDA